MGKKKEHSLVPADGRVIDLKEVNKFLSHNAYNLTATAQALGISRVELIDFLNQVYGKEIGQVPYMHENCAQILEESLILIRKRIALGDIEAAKLGIQLSCKFLFRM